jgi:hypothetical protein
MKKGLLLLLLAVCVAGAMQVSSPSPASARSGASARAETTARTEVTARPESDARAQLVLRQIRFWRGETWRWQRLMRVPRTASHGHERWAKDEYRTWIRDLWRTRAGRAYRRAANPPHERQWRCIQRYEGAWDDPNAPYWGGLQMDLSFQRMYGSDLLRRKGTADRWTPVEQMWVAERALRAGRGFHPWPNTARFCGLI